MTRTKLTLLLAAFLMLPLTLAAQDSLNVTFRFNPADNAVRSFVPGSFNNWGNNTNGRIPVADGSLLTEDTENGFSYQVVRLRVGGGATTHQGNNGYAYKFHEQYNASGSQWEWFTDPLNPIAVGPNSDSYIQVTHPLIFQLQPAQNSVSQVVPPSLWANVAAIDTDPIDLEASEIHLNGVKVATFETYYESARQLLHVPSLSSLATLQNGTNTVKVLAVTESGVTRELENTFTFLSGPETERQARPAGLEDGITIHDDVPGRVSFSLFAPGKEFVYLIGDHSDWEIRDEYLMKLDEARSDSAHFWITLDGLADGVYRFQYLVDGDLRIADLFSELVLDPDLDRFITSSVYPNMPEYPVGQTTGMVTVFEVGRTPFQWQSTDYQRPPQSELVIYELLLRDFVEESTFEVLRDTIGYLERLGVNAIELMPVSNFDGNLSWGYNPNFHGALDKSYGTRESFKRFVDEAHSRGIAVILDVVYNHTQEKSPLVMLYGTNPANNPFLGPGHEFNVFRHLNHNNPYIQYWLDRMNRYWMETYRVDGYRFDLTKGFATNFTSTNYNGYNAQRIGNLKRMADQIWDFDPKAYVILEHFAADSEERELAHYRTDEPEIEGMMFWNNVTHSYQEASMGYISSSNFSNTWYRNMSGWNVPNRISYKESHDEQWIMLKNLRFGNRSGSYDIRELQTALQRQELTGTFFFLVPGPRMMWQFGELGYGGGPGECLKPGNGDGDCLPSDPGRTGEKPIRWDYYDDEDRYRLYRVWSALINLRMEHPVFYDVSTTNVTTSFGGTVKQMRLSHPDMNVTVVGNFGVTNQTASVTFAEAGTWYDYFTGDSFEATQTTMSVEMTPGEYRVFTSKPLSTPELGRPVSVENPSSELPVASALHRNFPNPFNPTTTIAYDVSETMPVQIAVYDVLGRQVAVLVNETLSAGSYSATFNANNLSSGTYLVRMQAGSQTFINKMMLIK